MHFASSPQFEAFNVDFAQKGVDYYFLYFKKTRTFELQQTPKNTLNV